MSFPSSLPSRLLALLSPSYRRAQDARRAADTWRAFDEQRHYDAYLARCRAAFGRSPAPAPDADLEQHGFRYLRALSADAAAACIAELEAGHPQLLKKNSRHLEGFKLSDARLKALLDQILRGPVDQAVAGFFSSEYLVHWAAFSLTRAAPEQESVSFRWHCDKGPSRHLKLIVYLNPTAQHGGNTEFMDIASTLAVAERGYVFNKTRTRTGDTGQLARLAGRPLVTELRAREAGEAVLFQPSRALHRGISPTRGSRLTATLCLLPSPVRWDQALQSGALSDLAVDEKWHDDALAFLAKLEARLEPATAGA